MLGISAEGDSEGMAIELSSTNFFSGYSEGNERTYGTDFGSSAASFNILTCTSSPSSANSSGCAAIQSACVSVRAVSSSLAVSSFPISSSSFAGASAPLDEAEDEAALEVVELLLDELVLELALELVLEPEPVLACVLPADALVLVD